MKFLLIVLIRLIRVKEATAYLADYANYADQANHADQPNYADQPNHSYADQANHADQANQMLTKVREGNAEQPLALAVDDDGLIAMVDQQKQVMVNHNMTSRLNIQRTCQKVFV